MFIKQFPLPRLDSLALASLAASTLLVSNVALAQDLAISIDETEPTPTDADGTLNVYSADTMDEGEFELSVFGSYSENPTIVTNETTNDNTDIAISDRMTMNFAGGVGITEWFEMGLAVPLELYEGATLTNANTGDPIEDETANLGDVRLVPAFEIYDSTSAVDPTGVRVSVLADTRLPTSTETELRPDGFRLEPIVAVDADTSSRSRISMNAGYVWRAQDQVQGFDVSDAVSYGLGATVALNSVVAFSPEISGQVDTDGNEDFDIEDVPLQGLMGIAVTPVDDVIITARAGGAFTESFDSPDFRTTVGLTYAFGHDGMDNDQDGDGVLAAIDECPNEAEDIDGFEDSDGCIDRDNDQDGLADIADQCPMSAEDVDGFVDSDGCEDIDNDRDGFADTSDFCPYVAEDFDLHADNDGCPDVTATVIEMQCDTISIDRDVHFDTDSAVLSASAKEVLDDIATTINSIQIPGTIQIQGYADQRASDEYNLELSDARAHAVRDYLIEQGVGSNQLEVVALGEQAPEAASVNEQALQANRRVEFWLDEAPVVCTETAVRSSSTPINDRTQAMR